MILNIELLNIELLNIEFLNIKLLKFKWLGKISKFKKENNDSITNFIQLYATIKGKERLLMMVYKTPKNEAFRIPKYFDFLTK